ncbi:MAG: ribosome silencing factor [Chloroflexi bacterium]|nr:ribosome silencing factor [Chloroflexota bacterium]|tara:strand:- start:761 stop:1135 length:375 start_codon:yes stop_codon:yes gene_type:complete
MNTETELKEDSGLQSANLAYEIADDIQAENIARFNISTDCFYTDFAVIMTSQSSTHSRAICEQIESALKSQGTKLHHKEGDHKSGWILLDYHDLVIHIFDKEARDFYEIEHVWPNRIQIGPITL